MLSRYPALLMAAALLPAPPGGRDPRDRMLVSASWLKAHLSDPDLVLLQVGERAEYDREHIPGARYLQLRAISDRPAGGLSLEMLPITALDSALAALGVTAGVEGRALLRFRLGESDHPCVAHAGVRGPGRSRGHPRRGIACMEGGRLRGDRRGAGGAEGHAARDDG